LRVLLSAYACEPDKGSEPGIGWNWVRQVARFHEVWVITRANNREAIEQALTNEALPNVHWVYFDLPGWMRFWKKGERGLHPYYYLWQLGAYFVARRLHRRVRFDLVHHATFGVYWMPTFVSLLPVPLVWGSVGGGETCPRAFWRSFSFRGKVFELLRGLARRLGECDPLVRLTARRAAIALANTVQTQARLRALGCRQTVVFPHSALPTQEIRQLTSYPHHQDCAFRVLSLGRLLHWKGYELGLKAFAQFHRRHPASEYWVIGDGPERDRLKRLAGGLGVANAVVFWGSVTRVDGLERILGCHVVLHPALHDSSPMAVVEAMAAGRPVICLDLGGPGLQVSEGTGIRVEAVTPEQVVADLATALENLAIDPRRRAKLGEAARARIEVEFSWERAGERLAAIYEKVASPWGSADPRR